MQTKTSYSTLKDYRTAHSTAKKTSDKVTVTQYLDSLLLTKHTFEKLLSLCAEFNAQHSTNDFRTVARIKAHIRFREQHNNFVYEYTNNTVKLVSTNRAEFEKAQNKAIENRAEQINKEDEAFEKAQNSTNSTN